jgi:DNA primase
MPSFWAGRATENSEMDAKYLKPHGDSTIFDEPVFEYGTQGASVGDGVWITEGIQDAVAMNQHGGVYAVSPVAKDTSTRQRNQIIERAQKEGRAVICFDADEGGQGGAVSLALDLMSAGVQTEILPLPDGTDPCDYFMDGGEFESLEPVAAAKRVIEVKGDTDPLIKRLLDTASTGTPRGERLVDSISEVTPIRKEVLRDMMAEEREYENQHGWREPEAVRKTKGADPSFTFVYPDGTEIEMDSIGSRTAAAKFTDKFGAEFNYFPDISRSDLLEMVNRWMAEDQIELEEVDPLTPEGRTREKVQEKIQSASAVPDKDDLSAVGEGYVAYTEDESEILVVSDMVEDWVGELDISLRKASEYLAPVKSSNTRRLRVDGARRTFWVFDAEAIDENGYRLPEPKGLPGEDEAEEVEEL